MQKKVSSNKNRSLRWHSDGFSDFRSSVVVCDQRAGTAQLFAVSMQLLYSQLSASHWTLACIIRPPLSRRFFSNVLVFNFLIFLVFHFQSISNILTRSPLSVAIKTVNRLERKVVWSRNLFCAFSGSFMIVRLRNKASKVNDFLSLPHAKISNGMLWKRRRFLITVIVCKFNDKAEDYSNDKLIHVFKN